MNPPTEGHSLGGRSGAVKALSPEEMRQRRLAALSGGNANANATRSDPHQRHHDEAVENAEGDANGEGSGVVVVVEADPPMAKSPASSSASLTATTQNVSLLDAADTPVEVVYDPTAESEHFVHIAIEENMRDTTSDNDVVDDDEDAELQAALAMSLGDNSSSAVTTSPFLQFELTPDGAAKAKADTAAELEYQQQLEQVRHDVKNTVVVREESNTNTNNDTSTLGRKQQPSHVATTATTTTTDPQAVSNRLLLVDPQKAANDEELFSKDEFLTSCYETAEPFDIASFHDLMWDSALTTENDKARWVGQGIDVRNNATLDNNNKNNNNNDSRADDKVANATDKTMLDEIALTHLPWGLLQQHGGPCGVLAAVQAELLRILLWGARPRKRKAVVMLDYPEISSTTRNASLYWNDELIAAMTTPIPTTTSHALERKEPAVVTTDGVGGSDESRHHPGAADDDEMQTVQPEPREPLTTQLVRQALARSIAIVLARAALTPPAYLQDHAPSACESNPEKGADKGGVPGGDAAAGSAATADHKRVTEREDGSNDIADPIPPPQKTFAKVVLPTAVAVASDGGLTWEHLEPWEVKNRDRASSITSNLSTTLSVYTISLPAEPSTGALVSSPLSGPKRQKTANDHPDQGPPHHADSALQLRTRVIRLARAITAFLLQPSPCNPSSTSCPPLDWFRKEGGVLLLVMSLVASREKEIIQKEFDDSVGTRLTAQFGHCGQELINLLLTGQAVSNVFDNSLTPSGEMICRGIQGQPVIGYLSQLESLRYCEVGSYYKSPRFPIWVVGSTSHFTVLFGDVAALKESKSDMLLEKCRRAFKSIQGAEENGFIPTEQLGGVFKKLNLHLGSGVQTLAASLEVSGAGIILWDDFWKATSRLMTGASLETVLLQGNNNGSGAASSEVIEVESNSMDGPPRFVQHSNMVEPGKSAPAAAASMPSSSSAIHETDEEMARRLAAEWDNPTGGGSSGINALTAAARVSSPMEVDSTGMTDEELARKLQAEWDAEFSGGGRGGGSNNSVSAVNGSPGRETSSPSEPDDISGTFPISTPPLLTPYELDNNNNNNNIVNMMPIDEEEDSKVPASLTAKANTTTQPPNLAFERYGDSFSLYHYNGLRGGLLTPFRVTRLSAEEAVGSSTSLNRGNIAGGTGGGGGSAGDLEDVVRTKWPSCIINWLGKSPPYID